MTYLLRVNLGKGFRRNKRAVLNASRNGIEPRLVARQTACAVNTAELASPFRARRYLGRAEKEARHDGGVGEKRERRAALPFGGLATRMSKTKQLAVKLRHEGDGHGDPVVIAASAPGRSAPPRSSNSTQPKIGSLEHELAEIVGLDQPSLRARWADLFRRPPPKGISRRLLLYALAYDAQARAYGGLRPATRHKLLQAGREEPSTGAATHRRERRGALSPGSRLVREWQGRSHTAVPAGVCWSIEIPKRVTRLIRQGAE